MSALLITSSSVSESPSSSHIPPVAAQPIAVRIYPQSAFHSTLCTGPRHSSRARHLLRPYQGGTQRAIPGKLQWVFFGAITASARSVWLVWKLRRAVIAWVSEDVVAGRERARMVNGILEAMIGDGCLLAWIV